ncbi:MAG: hypothetical protein EHM32_05485 [Spirochaetales bacterium]|nr:MAG: hypothetical protein EHM32_05485 [Spirochaetales bacterium]
MKQTVDIILCRPDERRACCACCGAFNLRDISRKSIMAFLKNGAKGVCSDAAERAGVLSSHPRDESAHICPFQGYTGNKELPGCLVHPSVAGEDGRDRSLYGAEICEAFFCPAHFLLDSPAKHRLLAHVTDWYRYSIAIVDPLGFAWMLAEARKYADGHTGGSLLEKKTAMAINAGLEMHAGFMNGIEGALFEYSQSEYLLNYHRFSPGSGSPQTENHRRAIREMILRLLA